MDAHQALAVDDGVVLIDAVLCATVADEVLGARRHLVPATNSILQQPFRTYAQRLGVGWCPGIGLRVSNSLSGGEGHAAGEVLRDVALQARDELSHGLHDTVVLAVALVAPPPPRITAHLRTDSNISTTALKPDQTY
jgi:predicted RecB family endonuclease